jgi:carboxymethylenebutenolidase
VRPASATGRLPGILVVHENRGLNPHIEDIARRLALDNFMAFAPDGLFPLGGYPGDEDKARELFPKLDQAKSREDFVAAANYLKARNDCTGRIGAVGFCYGGGMTWQAAANHGRVLAAAPYYGPMPPLEMLKTTNAAILAHYAQTDMNVNGANNATIDATEKTLKDAGKIFEKMVHPGTSHGFNNDTGGNYHEMVAVNAWTATLDWFRRHLK